MRIIFLYMFPLAGNGSASYLRALCAQLVERGHEVAIVSPDKKRQFPGVKHYIVTPPQHGVFTGHPELPRAKKFEEMNGLELGEIYVSYLKASIEAVADFNPEIVHAFHTVFLPQIGRVIKLLFGMRLIITTHGSDLQYLAVDRRLNGLIKDAVRFAAAITANSDFTKKLFLELFGKSLKKKTKVIPGGVNLKEFKSSEKYLEEINRKYKLKDKKVVLFTGRVIKSKGIEHLIKAAPLIHGQILIVGDGPERKNLEFLVKKRGIKNVIFAGYTDNKHYLHTFYERAQVYVSPTAWEGFGLTILEAMAAHTPVIATNKGGVVSIIKNGVNGFLISPRSPREIAETVNRVLDNDTLRKKVAEEAYKTVVNKFTWKKIADEYEKIYKEYSFTTREYLKIVKGDDKRMAKILKSFKSFTPGRPRSIS